MVKPNNYNRYVLKRIKDDNVFTFKVYRWTNEVEQIFLIDAKYEIQVIIKTNNRFSLGVNHYRLLLGTQVCIEIHRNKHQVP